MVEVAPEYLTWETLAGMAGAVFVFGWFVGYSMGFARGLIKGSKLHESKH